MTQPRPSTQRILDDNLTLHNRAGYPRFYDQHMGLMTNRWERTVFLHRLEKICRDLSDAFPRAPLRVLDLGAGTGNLTIPLLHAGLQVTALDLSCEMLGQLSSHCQKDRLPNENLRVICAPADEILLQMIRQRQRFHLVCACSFYHHLPDYLATLELAGQVVEPGGCLFLSHEPMRKDTITRVSRLAQWVDFKLWRVKVRFKKWRGCPDDPDAYYDPNSLADYWDLTAGCDQDRMTRALRETGFQVEQICYDSKRSRWLHHLCRGLGTQSLFMIIAHRRPLKIETLRKNSSFS